MRKEICPSRYGNRPASDPKQTSTKQSKLDKHNLTYLKDAAMADAANLLMLLTEPSENPTVEYKSWLDLQDQEKKGLLAKAVIALANEGGGHLVIGFSDDGPELIALPRPQNLMSYDQDTINNIIKKFAVPHFHCDLKNVVNPLDGAVHPIVVVPGGHSVPIMSKSGTPKGSILAQTCYVRKPGPESAPPLTEGEWSRLLERCIRNRRADMLDGIRSILQGRIDSVEAPSVSAQKIQDDFVIAARARWHDLIEELADDSASRCWNGCYEVDFSFESGETIRLPMLLERMKLASRIRHTGWAPFWIPSRAEIAPKPINGTVECWHGRPGTARLLADAAHSDFWRMTPEARAFLIRGYEEDGLGTRPAGTLFDATLPIWRIGEIISYAGRLAAELHSEGTLQFRVHWSGLKGRMLTFVSDPSRSTGGHYKAAQDMVESVMTIPLDRIEGNCSTRPLFRSPGWGLTRSERLDSRSG